MRISDWSSDVCSSDLSADAHSAELVAPNGAVPISLQTITHEGHGTIDWKMTFPDGTEGVAYSRVTPDGTNGAVYSFVLMAPPVPLEMLEGALSAQMEIIAGELVALKELLDRKSTRLNSSHYCATSMQSSA